MLDMQVYCVLGRLDGQRARAEVAKKDVQLTQLQSQVRPGSGDIGEDSRL